jgi:DNA repair protein RadC
MKTLQTNISEVRLVYRTKVKASERLQVKCSKDAFDIFMENWDMDSIEHIKEFKFMLLNRSNKVLGLSSLSKGGTTGTVVDVKLLLQYTINSNANAIIVCHNHPSGNLQPSEADIKLSLRKKYLLRVLTMYRQALTKNIDSLVYQWFIFFGASEYLNIYCCNHL